MPITDAAARNAKPNPDKDYKLFDGHGLYLLVTKKGAKYWRFKYDFAGKERLLALGVYPDVSLKKAREEHENARGLLRQGVDPNAEKREVKVLHARTFQVVHAEWAEMKIRSKMADASKKKIEWLYRCHLAKPFGSQPIASITTEMIVAALLATEKKGLLETAHRMRIRLNQVMRYAKKRKDIKANPAADLDRDLLPALKPRHHAAIIEPARIGQLLRSMDGYIGQPTTIAALQLAPLVFVRPVELRMAQWREFDLERAEWRIPDTRMKEDEYHVVPLSRQALAILRRMEPYTRHSHFVFPNMNDPSRPMSENTIRGALIRLGYSGDEQTGHGFRTIASTMLNEQEYDADQIEKQLAHSPKDKVRAAYNRAQKLPARRKMMQEWADYLDQLRADVPNREEAAA